MKLRPEVRRFADEMERRLRAHDAERGVSWRRIDDVSLFNRATHELFEFDEALKFLAGAGRQIAIAQEAADTANYLMFIVENGR